MGRATEDRKMHITVEIRNVYGVETIYPADRHAEAVCKIAGTKTLTPRMIDGVRDLGIEILVANPQFKRLHLAA